MKILAVHKNTLIIFFFVFLAVIVGGFLIARTVPTSGTGRELPIYSVERDDKKISLTFDAAWDDADIPELIRILGERNVRASFFVVGDWLEKYQESGKALAEAGHEILNHSDTHAHVAKLSQEQVQEEVAKCDERILAITGQAHHIFRGPYGEYNNTVLAGARAVGDVTVQWDVDVTTIIFKPIKSLKNC